MEEINEIRKPKNTINLSIKNRKNYYSPKKNYKIVHLKKKIIEKREPKNKKPIKKVYDYMNLIPYSCQTITETKQYPLKYNEVESTYLMNNERENQNNIYLYQNERENEGYKNYLPNPKYNYNNYIMQYNNLDNYNNINTVTINPLYERMRKRKMNINNNGYFSYLVRRVYKDDNKVKIIYNQDNYNFSDNEDFNNLIKYGNEASDNNYFKNDYY